MTSVSRTFTVNPTPDKVIEYLKDFTHAEEWDPGTEKCTRNDAGPIGVGSNWHNVSKIFGVTTELTYTLAELEANKIVLVGTNEKATSTDTITVTAHGKGSELTYTADLDMKGMAKLATPAIKLVFEKLAGDTEKQLTEVLNKLA